MYRSCLTVGLLMLAASAAGQSPSPNASRAFPGAFGFAIGEIVDPARLQAAGFVERRAGHPPSPLWISERTNALFSWVTVTPMSGNMIGMINANAPMTRPAGGADSPAMREMLMRRCEAVRAAIIETTFAGFYQRIVNQTSTYIAERVEPGEQIAARGASRVILNCLMDSDTGEVNFTLQLGRSDF